VLRNGEEIPLTAEGAQLVGALTVADDTAYRVRLRDTDGLENAEDPEYFVRRLDDRPPDVRIIRPAGDKRVTPLEEVTIEARADDDHGLDRLELVVGVRGDSQLMAVGVEEQHRSEHLQLGGQPIVEATPELAEHFAATAAKAQKQRRLERRRLRIDLRRRHIHQRRRFLQGV